MDGIEDLMAEEGVPPIAFFYSRLHDSIREELNSISDHVLRIEEGEDRAMTRELVHTIHQKLKFLAQVYNYHSEAEDEIVYPALDSKVKNVTLPYRVEHADEGQLLIQLMQLLVPFPSTETNEPLRALACKVEEVSTTIRKHLAKEEEQLFPLLLEHFSYKEQASMIAQFLFCIPMMTVQSFLDWIQPTIDESERNQLVGHMRDAITDNLLLSLLTTWLEPSESNASSVESCEEVLESDWAIPIGEETAPLLQIANVHRSIDLLLLSFIQEARNLLEHDIIGDRLVSLLEKHRFLKDVCRFHMLSEEEIMLPELLKRSQQSAASCDAFHAEHQDEGVWFDDLGRLLIDVRSTARRGCNEAQQLLEQVVSCAEAIRMKLGTHMTREEREVFPILQEKLGSGEQCIILWRSLKMMPLRLLERVMPWIACTLVDFLQMGIVFCRVGHLTESEYAGWIAALRIGGMEDSTAVELLSRWARRGCVHTDVSSNTFDAESVRKSPPRRESMERDLHPTKRPRMEGSPSSVATPRPPNPVDHIFQFHRALRRDFRLFESETNQLVQFLESNSDAEWTSKVQNLNGRFTFILGLYQVNTHPSRHESPECGNVVRHIQRRRTMLCFRCSNRRNRHGTFHILTCLIIDKKRSSLKTSNKQAVPVVLFAAFKSVCAQMLGGLMLSDRGDEVHDLALKLSRRCAAVRSALETHLRAEETELWPLFAENFSTEEQQRIVGLIIGRTGAEVLRTMLPWVSTCFTEQEKEAMMESLHKATKKTRFGKWMENWNTPNDAPKPNAQPSPSESLRDVAEYLRSSGLQDGALSSSDFSPSFEDMFRMNQSQLEAAVRHVSSDPSLEPQRKSYLIQRILVSKYITGQQESQTMRSTEDKDDGTHYQSYFSKEKRILGCVHYQRNCALVAPCCNVVYVCRLCHDAEEDHKLNRYSVEEIVCMACGTRQTVSNSCTVCGLELAKYHCSICRLYDNQTDKEIYHCPFCNVCRRGKGLGVDFYHCMECNACMHTSIFNKHHCREKCIECDCPVCTESVFDSSLPIKELRCGHFLHASCFEQYSKWNYRCPICFRSLGDMSTYFRMLDVFLASDPMPEEFRSLKQSVVCNDCGKQSEVPYHFVYHCCGHCRSYNTRLL